jgi:NhaP-type Na+/H+ or K+/H+ antiporter
MIPVALCLVGSDLGRRAALFLGWFGPRGLASVVFALLAVEELGPEAEPAVVVIVLTVLLSVLAHGLTAGPLAVRYGAHVPQAGARQPGQPLPAARLARSTARPDVGAAAPPRRGRSVP